MNTRRLLTLLTLGVLSLLLTSVVSATAASNTVPASRVGEHLAGITVNDLKPPACAGLTLATLVTGSGTFSGTTASELLLGAAGNDTIDAADGNDCILAGAGDDHLIGGPGTDICLGGPGTNTYDPTCETATDSGCPQPGNQTVTADRDSPVRQDRLTTNFNGTATILEVLSEDDNKNMRVLVRFPLPTLPNGCTPTSATLRLYNASPTGGRTIEARRITADWGETTVTWQNQPGVTDPAATSTAPSTASWQSWTVTEQVRQMYTNGNHGFMLREQVESLSTRPKQTYHSRENTTNKPQLVVQW